MKDSYAGQENAGMKSSSNGKDAAGYSDKAGQNASAARKSAKLDSQGGVAKKDEAQYKENCKDQ